MSYMVGYQDKYPAHVHHRGASIPSVSILKSPIGCLEGFELWYNRQEANPNIIAGALVGGPNQKDEFYDQRNNYEQTEPAIAGTAPLVGLFARLSSLSGGSGRLCTNIHVLISIFDNRNNQTALYFCRICSKKFITKTIRTER